MANGIELNPEPFRSLLGILYKISLPPSDSPRVLRTLILMISAGVQGRGFCAGGVLVHGAGWVRGTKHFDTEARHVVPKFF